MMTFNTDHDIPQDLGNTKRLIEHYCPEEWQHVIDLYKTSASFKKNDVIFKEGQKIGCVHIVDTGKAKIYSTFNKKNERILRLAADEHIIGHRGIGEDFTYTVSAMALTDIKLTCIPINVFKSLLRANHLFSYYFMLFFAEELRRSERHIKDLERMTVTQKVAKALLMNVEAFGFDNENKSMLSYTLSRKDLSKLAGTTYETIIRELSQLNQLGVIKIDGKRLHILDTNKLIAYTQSADSIIESHVK